jgi:hypothetical protein
VADAGYGREESYSYMEEQHQIEVDIKATVFMMNRSGITSRRTHIVQKTPPGISGNSVTG